MQREPDGAQDAEQPGSSAPRTQSRNTGARTTTRRRKTRRRKKKRTRNERNRIRRIAETKTAKRRLAVQLGIRPARTSGQMLPDVRISSQPNNILGMNQINIGFLFFNPIFTNRIPTW